MWYIYKEVNLNPPIYAQWHTKASKGFTRIYSKRGGFRVSYKLWFFLFALTWSKLSTPTQVCLSLTQMKNTKTHQEMATEESELSGKWEHTEGSEIFTKVMMMMMITFSVVAVGVVVVSFDWERSCMCPFAFVFEVHIMLYRRTATRVGQGWWWRWWWWWWWWRRRRDGSWVVGLMVSLLESNFIVNSKKT